MRLRFRSRKLAELCSCGAALDRKWGQTLGGVVRRRLCLVAAVPNLELLARFPGVLKVPIRVDDRGRFSLNMERNLCILVEPDHDPIPYLRSGELACMQVERLIILEVNGFGL